MQPPRRRPAAGGGGGGGGASSSARPSKLAKEHNLNAQEESEIREAFSLFSEPMEGEKEGVIPIGDVRRAMIALGIPPSSPAQLSEFTAALDPEDEGFATYPSFLAICALQLHARRSDASRTEEAHQQEVDEAFGLFVGGGDGGGSAEGARVITLTHLKRVAALLKQGEEEGVTEELLRDMILEANGGAGVGRGVRKDEFDEVMRRAGVWR
ncbi:Centrin-4 [Madurella mycetomatis]|uniref:Centrin-4 n=1 Tax=Madurella mycetomatis TaxID=100816 RepID=A0A175W3S5_9PEZI|nr:Centrin-4 [Madurella mycetomatis]